MKTNGSNLYARRRAELVMAVSTFALLGMACAVPADPETDEPVATATSALGQGTFQEVSGFGSNPGGLKMYVYVPSPAPPAGAPLVLALHACSQDATQYRAVGWEELADQYGFYVVYPEQQTANNALRCFNWAGEYGNVANLTRGQGENESIKEMVDRMVADYTIDTSRVFAIGHSGGGAMVALLMSTWPDVFAGGGIMAGIPYECTTQFLEVSGCLNPGKNLTPQEWGDRARSGYPGYAGPYPKLSVWHGTNDSVVNKTNQTELIEQWANVHGLSTEPTSTTTVDGHTRYAFDAANGETIIESYVIEGGEHGSFVDPDQGCGATGSYILDYDICAAKRMSEFFGLMGSVPPTGSGGGGPGGGGIGGAGGGAPPATTTGSGGAGPDETECVAGRQKVCECEDGSESFKTCEPDGSGYGECDCPETVRELSSCTQSSAGAVTLGGWALFAVLGLFGLRKTRRRR